MRNRHGEPPWFATLNQTRADLGIPNESRLQRFGINRVGDQFAGDERERNAGGGQYPKLNPLNGEEILTTLARRHVGKIAAEAFKILFELDTFDVIQRM